MQFALSTCWFNKKISGSEIVDKALDIGFDGIELGYGIFKDQAKEILARRNAGEIAVKSIHAFAPVIKDDSSKDEQMGHPELHRIANLDEDARKLAVEKVKGVLEFAAYSEISTVVLHAGRVLEITKPWAWIHTKIATETNSGMIYKWRHDRVVKKRTALAPKYLGQIRKSLDELLPEFQKKGVILALENLPSWDALPQPSEMAALLLAYPNTNLRCWHDIGHGQVMENAGYDNHAETTQKLLPYIAGTHIHDVIGPGKDHQAPGMGGIDFEKFRFFAGPSFIRVFEPSSSVSEDDLRTSLDFLKVLWKPAS